MYLLQGLIAAVLFAGAFAQEDTPTTTSTDPAAPSVTDFAFDPIDGNVTANYRLYKFQGCTSGEQSAILDALGEAHTILKANRNYYIDSYWNSYGVVEFFSNPVFLQTNNHRSGLKQNLRNAWSFTNGWFFNSHTTAIYCHDGSLQDQNGKPYSAACGSPDYPETIVVAPEYDDGNTALMFCDSWFRLSTLSGGVKNGKSQSSSAIYDLGQYENRARQWITAMMLMPDIGTYPKDAAGNNVMAYQRYALPQNPLGTNPYGVSAAQCKYAAKLNFDDLYSFTRNPSSLSWYALSAYVTDQIGD